MQLNKEHYRRRGKSAEVDWEIIVLLISTFKFFFSLPEILTSGLEKCSFPARMYCFLQHKYQRLKMKVCWCLN